MDKKEELKRPEKKKGVGMADEQPFLFGQTVGYNQACEEWQAYHNQQMGKTISVERLRELINDSIDLRYNGDEYINVVDLAKAISTEEEE